MLPESYIPGSTPGDRVLKSHSSSFLEFKKKLIAFFLLLYLNFKKRVGKKAGRRVGSSSIRFVSSVRKSTIPFYPEQTTENSIQMVSAPGFDVHTLSDLLRIKKYLGSLPNSQDACGSKPYSERKRCGFKNTRGRALINRELTPRTPSIEN